jgi:hypothetical protein
MKTKLFLSPVNGGPFNCLPAREVELDSARVLCNDVTFPWEFNPYGTKLYVIGNEYGTICAVWANCEQEAFDAMVDEGLGDSFLVSEEDQKDASEEEQEEWARLGNAGEPCNLDYAWIQGVRLNPALDCQLLCAFAEARGNGFKNLDN